MKFLIDECLSPSLAAIARESGFPESTHVTWLGLGGREDWRLVRRAIDEGYALVINNRTDFTSLMRRESHHPGLLCLNLAHGLMRLEAQKALFRYALLAIGDTDLESQFLEIKAVSGTLTLICGCPMEDPMEDQ